MLVVPGRRTIAQIRILVLYSTALALGGLTTGVLIAVAGMVLPDWGLVRTIVALVVAMLALASSLGWTRIALPENRRQISQSVFRTGKQWAALRFGFELGTGLRTYLTTAAPIAVGASLLLVGDAVSAVMSGLGFGLGRSVTSWQRMLSEEVLIAPGDTIVRQFAVNGLILGVCGLVLLRGFHRLMPPI